MSRSDVSTIAALIVITPHLNEWIAYLLAAGYVFLAMKTANLHE